MKSISCALAGVALTALACAALAQDNAAPPTETVLAGPKVSAKAEAKSLVERDETGHVRRLDIPPAEAGLKLLKLDDATKGKAEEILEARAATLDKIVRENLVLLVKLANANKSGDKEGARGAMRELGAKAGPLRARGPLMDELLGVLSKEQGEKLTGYVQEYVKAIVAEDETSGRAASMKDGAPGNGRGGGRAAFAGSAERAEYVAAIGRELKRSYERVVTAAAKDFDELLKSLDLTPGQEAEVRRIAADSFQKTAGNQNRRQRGEVFAQIYAKLNAEQREKLVQRVRGDKAD